ncbi:phosphate ABC transporter substrate-binding/OmpA family protein [Rhodovulum euryhalinum]|uniref:Phosphate ABC transporter substrate-binding protein (PhoT family) n=1 Tax=Rhodovulum euryhalinum TaxID=35805 RepID=A0A4R2KLJ9_9RHOB|nr:phosphate ABC transporter substrate-binding/OmpA family protein [Rhodovulum euryhalinum]TCO73482.1 phosphate ABC transporter substrate-binding protein (PhoT family) [Rhodovulum euryhalinum]
MRFFGCAVVLAALCHSFCPSPARAQDVTLTSRDGSVEISGTLIGFDGEFYRVDTIYGPLTLDGQGVVCTGPGCPDMEAHVARFRLSGAPALGEVLIPALIEAYAVQRGLAVTRDRAGTDTSLVLTDSDAGYAVAEIAVGVGSTEEGFADLLADAADIVMAAREPRPEELRRLVEAGYGDLSDPARRLVVALDAIVPVVAPGQPVQALAIDDLIGIVTGKIVDWAALGGPDAPVSVHLLDRQNGMQQAVVLRLLSGAPPAPSARRHKGTAALAQAVARDPLGIGLTRLSALGAAQQVPLIGGCGMRLVATRQSVKTEDYPFVAPLFLYTPARRLPLFAREFLDWLDTPAAQLVIRRAGFVDQLADTIPFGRQGDRLGQAIATAGPEVPLSELQRLVAVLSGAERLTSTFRFREGGSAELDAQSYGNVGALARAVEAGRFDGRELIFAGFSDGEGPAEANRRLARTRAEAVRDAVRAVATAADPSRVKLRVEAFGEALPIACDQSAWGGIINRRVEVWLR